MIAVRRAGQQDLERCVDILARVPDYFTLDTHDQVREAFGQHPAWVATQAEQIIGFLLVERRYQAAAEITFAAVLPEHQARGVGTRLVDHALGELGEDGVAVVEVKTLDASAGYEPYAATRASGSVGGSDRSTASTRCRGGSRATPRPSTWLRSSPVGRTPPF